MNPHYDYEHELIDAGRADPPERVWEREPKPLTPEQKENELRAEYEEAVERVYAGRTFPEFSCKENGHGECAFTDHGPCTGELIDREIGRMRGGSK